MEEGTQKDLSGPCSAFLFWDTRSEPLAEAGRAKLKAPIVRQSLD